MKEYDKDGNPVKQPTIVIEGINQLAMLNRYGLKIYLSDHTGKVNFYKGELTDGKYLSSKTPGIFDKDGVATLYYNLSGGQVIREKVSIISRSRSAYGNTLILHRVYNLVLSN